MATTVFGDTVEEVATPTNRTQTIFGDVAEPAVSEPDELEAADLAGKAYERAIADKIPFTEAHTQELEKDRNERINYRDIIMRGLKAGYPGANIDEKTFAPFAKGTLLSTSMFFESLDDIAKWMNDIVPIGTSGTFKDISNELINKADYWENVMQREGTPAVERLVSGTLGAIPMGVIEFGKASYGIPLAAAQGAAESYKKGESTLAGAAIGGAKRYVLGKLLNFYSALKSPVVRRGLTGGTFGAASGLEGATPEEIAINSLTGAAMAGRKSEAPKALVKPIVQIKSPAIQTAEGKIYEGQNFWELENIAGKEGYVTTEGKFIEKGKTKDLGMTELPVLIDTAAKHLKTAKVPRMEIEAEKTAELGKRMEKAQSASMTATGERRVGAGLRELKGELTEYQRPEFEPLRNKFTQEQTDAMYDDIYTRPHDPQFFSSLNTAKAFEKVLNGYVPTRGEIRLLRAQWGDEFVRPLMGKMNYTDQALWWVEEVAGALKGFQAGGEISSIGRQGLPILAVSPSEYGKFVKNTVAAYKDPIVAERLRTEMNADPDFELSARYGVQYAKAGSILTEETFISELPGKTPIVGELIKRGEAAFVEPQNMARLRLWKLVSGKWEAEGKLTKNYRKNPNAEDDKKLKELAGWISDLTGRSEAGKSRAMKKLLPILNLASYSPRFAWSRVAGDLNPIAFLVRQYNRSPEMRKLSAKTFAAFWGAQTTVALTAYMLDPDGNEHIFNPLHSDFYKVKIGNSRYDTTAGIASTFREMLRIISGYRATQAGKIVGDWSSSDVRWEELKRFAKSKQAPISNMISELWTGEDFAGQKIDRRWTIPKNLSFLFLRDAIEAYQQEGFGSGAGALAASGTGIGVQTYPESAYTELVKFRDEIAQKEYKKNWEDLVPKDMKRLNRQYKTELETAEMKRKKEMAGRTDYDFVAEIVKREKEAGQEVQKKLSPEIQKELKTYGIDLGLSRRAGEVVMNDETFIKYQNKAAEILNQKLSMLISREVWPDVSESNKIKKINEIITDSKAKARRIAIREANTE